MQTLMPSLGATGLTHILVQSPQSCHTLLEMSFAMHSKQTAIWLRCNKPAPNPHIIPRVQNGGSSPCSVTSNCGLNCEWWMAHCTGTLYQAQYQNQSPSLSSWPVYGSRHSFRIMMPQVRDIKGQIAHWSNFARKHTG